MGILNAIVRGTGALAFALAATSAYADGNDRRDHNRNGGFAVSAHLSGAQEVTCLEGTCTPAALTPGGLRGGRIAVLFSKDFSQLFVKLVLMGDTSTVVAAHLHCAPAGANGGLTVGFIQPGPLALNRKVIAGRLSNDDVIPSPCGPNLAAVAAAIKAGLVYVNVHTTENPGGELRGQLFVE